MRYLYCHHCVSVQEGITNFGCFTAGTQSNGQYRNMQWGKRNGMPQKQCRYRCTNHDHTSHTEAGTGLLRLPIPKGHLGTHERHPIAISPRQIFLLGINN